MDISTLNLPPSLRESPQTVELPAVLRAGDRFSAAVLEVENGRDALIAFGRFTAYARLPLPVVAGQEIQVGVESTGQGLRLFMMPPDGQARSGLTPVQLAIDPFELFSAKADPAIQVRALAPGTTLQARVTGFEKNGQILLDLGGFKTFAKVDVPVRQGQMLPLTVIQNEPGLTMRVGAPQTAATALPGQTIPTGVTGLTVSAPALPPPTGAEMDGLRQAVENLLDKSPQMKPAEGGAATTPIQTALVNLQQILSPASTADAPEILMQRIRSFIENSGIYFEKRMEAVVRTLQPAPPDAPPTTMAAQLADHPAIRALMETDLKPNLLVLRQFLDAQTGKSQEADRAILETMKRVIERTLSNIAQQQQAATEKPVAADVFQAFSHLLFLADSKQNARLKVYYAKKSRDESAKPPRISLLLDMDRLGTLRSDLWMVGKDLNITFFVKDADVKSAIASTHHQIKTMLGDVFNTVAVSVVVSEKKIAQFDGEDLLPTNRRQLDVSV